LKEVIHERKSLMPAYDNNMLGDKDLRDLVAYLGGLVGQQTSTGNQDSGKDQH
jgi:hypothetical protein